MLLWSRLAAIGTYDPRATVFFSLNGQFAVSAAGGTKEELA